MPRSLAGSAALLLSALPALAADPVMPDTIRYTLGWDDPARQLYTVTVTAEADGAPLVFSLPAWRPGRYIVQNYAANVQRVRATDAAGRALPVERIDLDSWRVEPGGAAMVTLAYEYYAHTFDAGSSLLRPDVAYFNPVNLFPWVEGRIDRPVALSVEAPADWRIATQLEPVDGHGSFRAADYHRLADSPTIAAPSLTTWRFTVHDVPYHVVFRGDLDLAGRSREAILADLEALTREQVAIFGSAPFDEYWHLYQLVPYPFGHAVEHEASASYVLGDDLFATDAGYEGLLSVTSHELFHAWNVKRIRPAALWPYDYATPQLTRLHWVTEGVTSYFGDLVLARAGLVTRDRYFATLAGQIGALQASPGRLVQSASMASLTSWFSGYGAGNPNQSISFYLKGGLLGLLLDLRIRDATDGARGLDDVMRHLWREHYERGRGVPEDGVRRAVEAVAGRPFGEFFAAYVDGLDELPFGETLEIVGLSARQVVDPDRPAARIGLGSRSTGDRAVVTSVAPDGPAIEAGLLVGEVIVAAGGAPLPGGSLAAVLSERQPGDRLELGIERDGEPRTVTVTLADGGNLRWTVEPVEESTERQLRLREGWLASQAGR